MTVTIERAGVDRGAAIAEVHRCAAVTAYADIFPPSSVPPAVEDLEPEWSTMLTDPGCDVFVAGDGESVIGAVALRLVPEVPSGMLLARLYVHPDRWGTGVGAALHDHAVAIATERVDRLNLWVLEANGRARAMYERRGWTLVPGWSLANDPPEVIDVLYELELGQH